MTQTTTTPEAPEQVRSQYGEAVELRVSEVRAASDDTLTVSGYAAVFDDITDIGYFKERIARAMADQWGSAPHTPSSNQTRS